jgi:LuxR family transcriptional regulator, maltose regulon positive regulatory protein
VAHALLRLRTCPRPACHNYLAEEVLEQQNQQLRTFLLETSVLDRLSGPLSDAVTGREGSQALLEEAEHAGLS